MERYIVVRTHEDGTRTRVSGTYQSRQQAERALREVKAASRNGWAVQVVRADMARA